MSEKQYRDKIVTIKKQQATDETNRGKARSTAGKHRVDAAREVQKITPRTSVSMARTYQRNAENLEKRAQAEDKKVTDLSVKLGRSAGELATAEENLSREIRSTAKKEEDKRKAEARNREQSDARRQQRQKSHARPVARLASPTVHYVMVQPPKPEVLRVLYMTANPEIDLRTEVEVRDVQQAVKRALHRERIDIKYWSAATPEDMLARDDVAVDDMVFDAGPDRVAVAWVSDHAQVLRLGDGHRPPPSCRSGPLRRRHSDEGLLGRLGVPDDGPARSVAQVSVQGRAGGEGRGAGGAPRTSVNCEEPHGGGQTAQLVIAFCDRRGEEGGEP